MQIDQINFNQPIINDDHIDRIINATRINEMQELKKLIRFIDHLIQSLLHQVAGGLLSEKGAKIKMLQLFSIIQHCQIGNHPVIKNQLQKLKQCFENKFKINGHDNQLNFTAKPIILSAESIQHYIENIKDSQADPIYSEQPKSLLEIAAGSPKTSLKIQPEATKKTTKKLDSKIISEYYLSNLLQNKVIQEKVKQHVGASDVTLNENKKRYRQQKLTQFIESIPKTVTTLA